MFTTGNHILRKLMILMACITLCACASSTVASPSTPKVERVIIQFKAKPTDVAQAVQQLAQQYQLGMSYERELGGGYYIAKLEPAQASDVLQNTLSKIAADPSISSIEADMLMQTMPSK
ncbi:hypothetical protein HQ393_14700 [Chitinibacter bivalviorum]|uniref:Lipoprotein n=1 Tax=Chitinibacter bivalviorum TaxID=2739434 RepID=A0A7H9BPX7_9NEIS|nr:hypothetical protein [Chitinibacter bivalviorum]QLG89394.1 hypothetical protein HQ393_14700 [Chitinibacter bivalviorum]